MSDIIKIEMVEQLEPFSDSPWFGIRVNDKVVKWCRDKETAQAIYDEIISDPSVLKTKENILYSQDIIIPL
tara:strand:+ start:1276 stop:1488 length:213 start_codon:yes stop_codon:yes gene_type:complete